MSSHICRFKNGIVWFENKKIAKYGVFSSLYYKDSKNPMFEISIEQLIDFLSYFIKRIELIIDNLLQGKLKIVNRLTNENIKNIKLSKAVELIESRKSIDNKPKKNNIFKNFFTNSLCNCLSLKFLNSLVLLT